MAGWSILTDGSALDCVEILRNGQGNGFCLDLGVSLKGGVEGDKDKLRCLFDQIICLFLKGISIGEEIRPLPAMLGDGRCVDLFKIFWVVRRKGGYDRVSKNGLWTSVAEESGLDLGVISSLKLIYNKYLDTLDRWLQRIFRDKGIVRGLSDCGRNLGLLSVELETEFKGLLSEISDQMEIDEDNPQLDSEENELLVSGTGNSCNSNEVTIVTELDGVNKCVDADEDVVILDQSDVNEKLYSLKRKRECLSRLLNWVREAAKNPGDPLIGTLSEGFKQKVDGGKELRLQALLAREALLVRRHIYSTAVQSLLQKRQKMHPYMYEDHQSPETSRCSQRLISMINSRSRSCSESSSTTHSDLEMSLTPCMVVLGNHPDKRSLGTVDSLTENRVVGPFGGDHLRKHVAVGPLFQAKVPDWTSVPSESDSKWLGTQIWPLETGECNLYIKRDPIGRGRPDSCDCRFPGSVECVRFHIAEKRMKLKLELGSAFHHWRFNYMGEEVSLSWTEEEEKRFKAVVRLNPPSLGKCFWDQAFKCFSSKRRRELVSYYFNVFLLQRRSYQNRVSPNTIDSDDDESEFGSISNSFGREAVKDASSKFLFCVQNKQCIDLEDHTWVN